MIGSFLYSSRLRAHDVTVWLQRGGESGRARIILPREIESAIVARDYPPPAPSMSIESALSYAIFLAIRTETSLVIAGDRTQWNPDWGYLTDLGNFTGYLVTPAARAGE